MANFSIQGQAFVRLFSLISFLNAKLDFMIANKLSNNHKKRLFEKKLCVKI